MPGSIQVSVLGLMDLVSPPPLSSLSLKVVMGKRDYCTVGDGELTIPVMSLRENLMVALHDAEGEELLRTEFGTMLLLERVFWEALFPLKNGGSLHMKLQFSLSAEDRKRIREMRDSALKERLVEKRWRIQERSLSDNKIVGSITTKAGIIPEEISVDHSELSEPGVGPCLGKREKFHGRHIDAGGSPISMVTGKRNVGNIEFPQTISKSLSSGLLCQSNSQAKSDLMGSFVLNKKSEPKKVIPAMNYGNIGSMNLKIDKETHKVENGMEDNKLTKNIMTSNNVHITIGTGKTTDSVLSAITFDERKDFVAVDVEKGSFPSPKLKIHEAVGETENLNLMQRGDSLDIKARTSSQCNAELPASDVDFWRSSRNHNNRKSAGDKVANFSGGVDGKTLTRNTNGNNNKQKSLTRNSLALNVTCDELEKIGLPYEQSSLEVVRTVNDENAPQTHSNGLAASDINLHCNDEQTCDDESHNSEKVMHTCQQLTSVELDRTVNEEIMPQITSDEQAVPESAYEKAGELESCYHLVGTNGYLDIWTSRHLCITTGSNLLRDFAESIYVASETDLFEKFSLREVYAQEHKYGEACIGEGNESTVVPSFINTENLPSSLKSIGNLIEQDGFFRKDKELILPHGGSPQNGLQITVIIAACCLLFKSR